MTSVRAVSAWEGPILRAAALDSVPQARPAPHGEEPGDVRGRGGSVLTTLIWLRDLVAPAPGALPAWFTGQVALWLWFTVLFANFAEALAEGRGKAQAAALRGLRQETMARKLVDGPRAKRAGLVAAQGRRGGGRSRRR